MNNQRSVSSLITRRGISLAGIVGLGLALGIGSIAQAQVAVEHGNLAAGGEDRSPRRRRRKARRPDRCPGQGKARRPSRPRSRRRRPTARRR